ncbi:biotin/lipoyl-binding protein [Paraburkholderia caledonica]|uniref:Multidrug efflux pump subunit AcrA (Membrane-fusion protein) n=1 Tax=Paraburkholderia caledonica TaxID=134536 RepID=A0AB73IPG7_9BURK|nr:multidrug efflux pump subunit AcrA (membrane-fusion protein) [Paraburkholderia caledonica]
MKTQVNGTLDAVLVKEGQQVKAGQVIARISSATKACPTAAQFRGKRWTHSAR